MGDSSKEGLEAAITVLMARTGQTRAAVDALRGEQLALLPSPPALELAGEADEPARRSGPGRPPGSKNKRTEEWIDFIGSRYRSPLLFLAETYNRPVQQLAHELNTTSEKAFALQLKAAESLAPYWHQRQPQAVALTADGEIGLTIITGTAGAATRPGDGAVLVEGELLEDQGVSGDDPGKV